MRGEVGAEERDGGHAELGEAEDFPGSFDEHHLRGSAHAVEPVEQRALWESRREDPLSPVARLQASPRVAERGAVGIVETDADAASQHAAAVPCPDLIVSSGLDSDPPVREEGVPRIEGEPGAVGREGRRPRRRRYTLDGRRVAGDRGEDLSSLAVAAAVEPPDELDDVPAAIAAREATPEAAAAVHDEGSAVVSAVDRAGADEAVAAGRERVEQAPACQDLLDGDALLEQPEVQTRRDAQISSPSSTASRIESSTKLLSRS